YSYTNGIGCMIWNGNLLDMKKFLKAGADLFVRIGHKEIGKKIKYKGGLYFKRNEETSTNFSDLNMLGENPELPFFTIEKVLITTNNFTFDNSFCSVYKVLLTSVLLNHVL
ncbi:hypothetical protein GIB67_035711, partial [Kingdonia uniflora]